MAYESLLTARRQWLHAAAGQALETLYADRLEVTYDRLAYHYAKTDNAAKAVAYLSLVAEKAAQGYAHTETITSLQEALVHAERLPADERDRCCLDVAIRQAESLYYLGYHQELIDLLLRYQERSHDLQESVLASLSYIWVGQAYMFLGQREQAMQNFETALQQATRCGDKTIIGRAYFHLGSEHMFAGRLTQAIADNRQAVRLLGTTAESRWMWLACQVLSSK